MWLTTQAFASIRKISFFNHIIKVDDNLQFGGHNFIHGEVSELVIFTVNIDILNHLLSILINFLALNSLFLNINGTVNSWTC